ncbi:MAG TPA: hypothetical protein PKA28_02125 [Methylomusa anaerophila]|uniref:Uncharacterized protein n=1 Tax=Methylomusa anaerophila TaxID=1930071 RepID=A0A348APD8_9FIRM|nr:hypothetical protein [Methylomusa anaerophila]BBB92936.1 hypothetical protein MAMMFC1_03644 [Methylomusa anaerophila]HML87230.1 hypothetical protein [Methylomusa anaerophila]
MIVTFMSNSLIRLLKLGIKVALLTLIIFYILPKLMTLLWEINNPELKIRERQLLEKPLRVIINTQTTV